MGRTRHERRKMIFFENRPCHIGLQEVTRVCRTLPQWGGRGTEHPRWLKSFMCDRYMSWQGRWKGDTLVRDVEKGLGSVKIET